MACAQFLSDSNLQQSLQCTKQIFCFLWAAFSYFTICYIQAILKPDHFCLLLVNIVICLISGKGESVLDKQSRSNGQVRNGTGDVACDSYYHLQQDIELLKRLGVRPMCCIVLDIVYFTKQQINVVTFVLSTFTKMI